MLDRWIWLQTGLGEPAWNMALDDALLATAGLQGCGVVRSYGWRRAAATFGYSQHYREVEALTELRPLIRRPTGGGVVRHDHDWTYSVIIPPGHPWHRLRAKESYRRVHDWVAEALARLGHEVTLAGERTRSTPGACFVGAEADDVLCAGRKVAGAAQRRNRSGLLIQGSVQLEGTNTERDAFDRALREAGGRQWGGVWEPAEVPDRARRLASELMETKYGCEAFNRAR